MVDLGVKVRDRLVGIQTDPPVAKRAHMTGVGRIDDEHTSVVGDVVEHASIRLVIEHAAAAVVTAR